MGTTAELAAMKVGADTLDQLGAQMNATLGQLRTDVEMTQAAWAGAAQVAFRTVMARWDESSLKLNTALNEISSMLTGNTTSYNNAELQNETDLNSLGSAVLNV